MLCKNDFCRQPLRAFGWGDGYCCKKCFERGPDYVREQHDNIPNPNRRGDMARLLASNADLFEGMTQAAAIDPRLPRIIYLRKSGKTLRQIGAACGIGKDSVDKILQKATPNLLRACGL